MYLMVSSRSACSAWTRPVIWPPSLESCSTRWYAAALRMEAATATPPRITADNVGNTTRSKRRDRTRQFFSPFCNERRPAAGAGCWLAGELPLWGAVPSPAAPFGNWARLAGTSKDAVGTRAGDRRSVSRAGLPVISRLDRTVLHLSPGERQASTEPRYAARRRNTDTSW